MSLFTPARLLLRKIRIHLRHVWQLSLPYFRSEERWRARFLLLACIGLNLGMVYVLVLLNDWNRVFTMRYKTATPMCFGSSCKCLACWPRLSSWWRFTAFT